jgi:hypothetical protein
MESEIYKIYQNGRTVARVRHTGTFCFERVPVYRTLRYDFSWPSSLREGERGGPLPLAARKPGESQRGRRKVGRSRARSINHHPAGQVQPMGSGVTQSMSDFVRPPDIKARFMFLLALRVGIPVFWETLRKVRTPEAVIWWAGQWNVMDEWLLTVARDTLEYWESDPGSPDAALNPAYKWFLYRPVLQGEQKPFQLVLENPRPMSAELAIPLKEWTQLLPISFMPPDVPNARNMEVAAMLDSRQKESIEEFRARVMRTCEEQLREYESDFHRRHSRTLACPSSGYLQRSGATG